MLNFNLPSFQTYFFRGYLRLLRFLRQWEEVSLEKERDRFRKLGRLIPVSDKVKISKIEKIGENNINSEWFEPENVQSDEIIFFIHGGGYVMGDLEAYRGLIAQIAELSKRKIFATSYLQAPEFPFPTALNNVFEAYRWLIFEENSKQYNNPKKIILMGDSAGGGLVASLLLKLKKENLSMPKSAILIAPWVDLTLQSPSILKYADRDMILDGIRMRKAVEFYVGQDSTENPYISPIFGDLAGFPPVFIQAGTYDILFDDSRRFAKKLKEANVPTTLDVWRGMPHVWHIIGENLPEAKQAIEKIVEFLDK
jgi:epsilon-lactone hydrolase